jgi:molybdopterin molybdotransferase
MPEFLELLPPAEALSRLFENYYSRPECEIVETIRALDRVTFVDIFAPHPLPLFVRSTVDGYAVRAKDTYGASGNLPSYFEVVGEVRMGEAPGFDIASHQCALIHTGGMLPDSADAVVMVEHAQQINDLEVEILRSVAVYENIVQVGEDVSEGHVILSSGTRIRPADIGGLISMGITNLEVSKKPRVGVLSSGDELVNPEMDLSPGKVRDINSYSLSALVESLGGVPIRYPIAPDSMETLQKIARNALIESDLLIFTAGSSASTRDLTSLVINQLGSPGVLVHGINIRPGKPTILAVCDGKPVIGLPGNPVSALVIADRFVRAVIEAQLGVIQPRPRPRVSAHLSTNLSSQAGREDWIPVRLLSAAGDLIAEPIFGKSNLIFTLSRADGMICIQAEANGVNAGELVDVYLLD